MTSFQLKADSFFVSLEIFEFINYLEYAFIRLQGQITYVNDPNETNSNDFSTEIDISLCLASTTVSHLGKNWNLYFCTSIVIV